MRKLRELITNFLGSVKRIGAGIGRVSARTVSAGFGIVFGIIKRRTTTVLLFLYNGATLLYCRLAILSLTPLGRVVFTICIVLAIRSCFFVSMVVYAAEKDIETIYYYNVAFLEAEAQELEEKRRWVAYSQTTHQAISGSNCPFPIIKYDAYPSRPFVTVPPVPEAIHVVGPLAPQEVQEVFTVTGNQITIIRNFNYQAFYDGFKQAIGGSTTDGEIVPKGLSYFENNFPKPCLPENLAEYKGKNSAFSLIVNNFHSVRLKFENKTEIPEIFLPMNSVLNVYANEHLSPHDLNSQMRLYNATLNALIQMQKDKSLRSPNGSSL